MKITFVASEAAPFLKTGGLGDVAGALPVTLAGMKGNRVDVFLPLYRQIKEKNLPMEKVAEFTTQLSWRRQYTGIYHLTEKKVHYYFVDNEYYFCRDKIYGELDDGERFAFFSKAVLGALVELKKKPDVLHCNDWQTGLIPVFLDAFYRESLKGVKTLFTIHNIEYQGLAHPYFLGDGLGLGEEYAGILRFGDMLNAMKGAILLSDGVNTVSRTYSYQLREAEYSHGLDGILSQNAHKFTGIVNGIDQKRNDPKKDMALPVRYNLENVSSGKEKNKKALQKELGLPERPQAPLFGMVSRLVSHKGTDLLLSVLDRLAEEDVQVVILGTGDPQVENALKECAARHPDKICVQIRFDSNMASRIYASCDFYLMPSRSEPCGLSQLIAMRYGTIPVVHATGGLRDTVIPFDPTTGEGVGVTFQSYDAGDFWYAICRAISLYHGDGEIFARLRKNAMEKDSSWNSAAEEYMTLYRHLTEGV